LKLTSGFFAKINNKYIGPFQKLSDARNEARPFGKDVEIYNGQLTVQDDGEQCDKELYLIPKVKK